MKQEIYKSSQILIAVMGMTFLSSGCAVYAEHPDAAEAMAERMLSAIGGRAEWAGLRNTINGSQQNRANEPTAVYAVITMDFEQPRFRRQLSHRRAAGRVTEGQSIGRIKSGQRTGARGDRHGCRPTGCRAPYSRR